ncbi:MAG TPA: AAA family ATPase [Candidatus Dormibacteraeota bacterium]|nr:AAA family ATPase [Candidatus Dormibacteraeota bacterium]
MALLVVILALIALGELLDLLGRPKSAYGHRHHNFKRRSSFQADVLKPKIKPKPPHRSVDIDSFSLSQEQVKLLDWLENASESVFITGKAGTGKSLVLQYFQSKTAKNIVVVAPTGVAALNIGGQTIHSLFKLPPTLIEQADIKLDPKTKTVLAHVDAVVIDEVSMVRVDQVEAINYKLKLAKNNNLPFGGCQIIMFGDPYQLPPVISDPALTKYFNQKYGGPFFFNAPVWQSTKLNILELQTIFRQQDKAFKDILNQIRVGAITPAALEQLNERLSLTLPRQGAVTLTSHNASVSAINEQRLSELPGKTREYDAQISGQLTAKAFPTEQKLRLKVGAQVILLKNDRHKGFVNGSLGKIKALGSNQIKVEIDTKLYVIEPETWTKFGYYYDSNARRISKKIIGSFTQFPIRLAWAMTIHKAQGQTHKTVIVDLGRGAFAHGQAYVALSRCVALDGLYLKSPIIKEDLIVDPAITNFMKPQTSRQLVHTKSHV